MKKIISMLLVMACLFALSPMCFAEDSASAEYALFPAYTMEVNQLAYESYSHGDQNAIDILPGGNVFAPFTGEIVYVDPSWGYVVLQSSSKVNWADGSYDYMTVGFMHDSDISDIYVGRKLKQGEEFYQAGGMGEGKPDAYGSHVHLTVHRGKVTRGYPYGNGDEFAFNALFVDPNLTTKYSGRGEGYVYGSNRVNKDAPTSYEGLWKQPDGYLYKCQYTPAYLEIKMKRKAAIKALPCSKGTFAESEFIRDAKKGEVFTVTGLFQNTAGNYWYQLEVDGTVGYIYAGDATVTSFCYDDVTVSNVSAPTSLNHGGRFSIKGKITSEYNKIVYVEGWIRDRSGRTIYYCKEDVNGTSYDILNSDIDMAMLFNELPRGEYVYEALATVVNFYSVDAKNLKVDTESFCLGYSEFQVN